MDAKGIRQRDVNWIKLTQDIVLWRAFVNTSLLLYCFAVFALLNPFHSQPVRCALSGLMSSIRSTV
jgi:hypothetical protein